TFAGELRTELGNLGCTTTVVEDGNAGLQLATSDKPDLILLSIELPRMNGFSVCNKLKKDASLKDVPLIIMSSESSDETFDQHKKLRTRAEDYVHKPIAFGELLEHIRQFVPMGAPAEADGGIVIDEEIEVGSADYLLEDDGSILEEEAPSDDPGAPGPAAAPPRESSVDPDMEAFAESAFGRLTAAEVPAQAIEAHSGPHSGPNGSTVSEPVRPRSSIPPAAARVAPRSSTLEAAEHEQLSAELAATRERLEMTERELDEARRETGKLRLDAGDSARLMREIEELRGKVAAASRSGGISSRDLLDLREALNKKDKEILAYKEQLSKKDREIVEAQDRALTLERSKADVEDRLLGVERELAEANEKSETLVAEWDAAKKAAEDLRNRADRLKAEGDSKDRQLAELRAKQADERGATEMRLAAVRAEADQLIASERAEHARALDLAEQRRGTDLDQAWRDRESAITEARDQAEREKRDALSDQTTQLRQEHDANVGLLRRMHQQEVERTRAEGAQREQAKIKAIEDDRDSRIAAIEASAAREVGEARGKIAEIEMELSAARGELESLAETKRADDKAHDARVAEVQRRLLDVQSARDDLEQQLASAAARASTLERDLDASRSELQETKDKLASELSRAERTVAKWESDRQSLERAKDALAVALAQIEETEVSRPRS
ncbi:MAG TPA: response regulator, partial [Polyangiaceae bacterium]|nr:response regulator [Polyangiaceae bacterium]